MQITRQDFEQAARTAGLESAPADRLWLELERRARAPGGAEPGGAGARFDLAHLAYYFGAVIVLGAMGWFMSNAWEAFGGKGIFAIAALYAFAFALAGWKLWRSPEPALRTPGGLLVALAVGMMPLAIYGLERWIGWWPQDDPGDYARFHPWVNGSWVVMELGTVLAGAVALGFVRFPFLTLPIAFALWFMSMDLTPLLFHRPEFSWDERKWVSLWFGLAMLAVALGVDIRRRWRAPDYGFWLSLFGLLAFWGGLSFMDSDSEWGKAAYALINLALMGAGVIFDRRAFVVFGALGVNMYLGHLAHNVFASSLLFPFALSLLGLLVIAGGVLWHRQAARWRAALLSRLPAGWHDYLPLSRSEA